MKFSLSLFLLLAVSVSMGQWTDGGASRLGKANLAKLRALKKRFAVPTYVPSGFSLKRMTVEEPNDPQMLTLTLRYANARTKGEFIVQMCSDGIGDVFFTISDGDTVAPTGEVAWKSPSLGRGIFEVYAKGKVKEWHLNWIELKTIPTFLSVIGNNMNAAEGKKIIEGLRWLK